MFLFYPNIMTGFWLTRRELQHQKSNLFRILIKLASIDRKCPSKQFSIRYLYFVMLYNSQNTNMVISWSKKYKFSKWLATCNFLHWLLNFILIWLTLTIWSKNYSCNLQSNRTLVSFGAWSQFTRVKLQFSS